MTKELEDLIKATLEDGVLEDYEKEALVKRAQKEGMDLVELEIYINALLQKRKRELKEKNEAIDAQYEKEKKEAIGPVCPKCGKQVPPLTLKCECGYEFVKSVRESKVMLLMNELREIKEKYEELRAKDSYKAYREKNAWIQRVVGVISSFEVPSTKEDIVEFLSAAVPKARLAKKNLITYDQTEVLSWCIGIGLVAVGIWLFGLIGAFVGGGLGFIIFMVLCELDYDPSSMEFNESEAWRNKIEEVMMKARSLRGDPEFTRQLDYYENMLNKK